LFEGVKLRLDDSKARKECFSLKDGRQSTVRVLRFVLSKPCNTFSLTLRNCVITVEQGQTRGSDGEFKDELLDSEREMIVCTEIECKEEHFRRMLASQSSLCVVEMLAKKMFSIKKGSLKSFATFMGMLDSSI